jgi:peptide/nickel transport system substrate-binding protein
METRQAPLKLSRRELLQSGLAAGATWSAWPLYGQRTLWAQEAATPKRGGMLRVRGWDPVHFDPHLTRNFKTHTTLSFVYSKLLRHKVGADVQPGTFIVEPDLEALKQSHPHLRYQDIQAINAQTIWMRTDKTPFSDVRVRRAMSHAIDRRGLIEAVWMRGEFPPAVAPGLTEWSLPIDQLGEGATYYRYDPQEARRLLADAGYAKGLKTTLTTTGGYGRDLLDAVQMVQRYLKDVGIEVELKIQEYGAYQATTGQGKFEGMAMGPYGVGWEPDSALYGPYTPDKPRNRGHVNDPKLAAMVKEQRQLKDLQARKLLIFDIQRYAAQQQYYIYLASLVITSSWQPYMKNYVHNLTFDYGSRLAVTWLDR